MKISLLQPATAVSNPLNQLESWVEDLEWAFTRLSDSELCLHIQGRWAHYNLLFCWLPQQELLSMACGFDCHLPLHRRLEMADLLMHINERLLLGHFSWAGNEGLMTFRYGLLLAGMDGLPLGQMDQLVQLALTECDRYFPAVQYLVWGGQGSQQALDSALLDTVGEA